LRILQVEHASSYAVAELAHNPALANLTHLWFHPRGQRPPMFDESELFSPLPLGQLCSLVASPHLKKLTSLRFRLSCAGDEGIRLLIDSGFLKQLRVLDMRHGCVTDDGARLLADCPDTRNLELLDLTRNQLSRKGIALLRGLGIEVRCGHQHRVGSKGHLFEGDTE
jgi:hypothetical protein